MTYPMAPTVTADEGQLRPTVTAGVRDGAGGEVTRTPAPPGRPARAVEQAQLIFHELHADGRNTLCAVCDSQYESLPWGLFFEEHFHAARRSSACACRDARD